MNTSKIISLDQARDPRAEVLSNNSILDSDSSYSKLDLIRHVDEGHLLKRLSGNVASRAHLPVNTVFMMDLGIFASMAARKFYVEYQDGTPLPIGLYIAAEQPSGTGKTRCLSAAQNPFYELLDTVKADCKKRIKELEAKAERTEQESEEQQDLIAKLKRISSPLFVTNSTPEALDQILHDTNGFFSAVSSEQGLLNSLLGKSYQNGANNNDSMLNGFDGARGGNLRASRSAYSGRIVGGVVCFAQQGSIETILGASNGTGLSERFLMLAEPHKLGTRDHTKYIAADPDLEKEYCQKCGFFESVINDPTKFSDLCRLEISKTGFRMINEFRNEIEPHLADGGKYSHVSLRGSASKIDMQIMKISANLHLLDTGAPRIDDKHIKAAIGIAGDLLEENLRLCRDKGIIGLKAEFQAVISYLSSKHGHRAAQDIINSLRNTRPFKDFTGNKPALIRSTLSEMVEQGLIVMTVLGTTPAYSMY